MQGYQDAYLLQLTCVTQLPPLLEPDQTLRAISAATKSYMTKL